MLSTIVFWLLVTFILFIPGYLALPNHYIIYADLGMPTLCIPALFFNRAKKPQVTGILLTFAFEVALTIVVFTTWPLDEPSIQQFELFVFGELLCVSLLAPGSVFIVMVYNMAVITTSLLWQPHDLVLAHDLASQFIPRRFLLTRDPLRERGNKQNKGGIFSNCLPSCVNKMWQGYLTASLPV